jgi:hypothetical protein
LQLAESLVGEQGLLPVLLGGSAARPGRAPPLASAAAELAEQLFSVADLAGPGRPDGEHVLRPLYTVFLRTYFGDDRGEEQVQLCCVVVRALTQICQRRGAETTSVTRHLAIVATLLGEISIGEPPQHDQKALAPAFSLSNTNRVTDSVTTVDASFSSVDSGRDSDRADEYSYSQSELDEYSYDERTMPSIPVPSLKLGLGGLGAAPAGAEAGAGLVPPQLSLPGPSDGTAAPPSIPQIDFRAATPEEPSDTDGSPRDDTGAIGARLMYRSEVLHVAMLELLLALLVAPSGLLEQDDWEAVCGTRDVGPGGSGVVKRP